MIHSNVWFEIDFSLVQKLILSDKFYLYLLFLPISVTVRTHICEIILISKINFWTR